MSSIEKRLYEYMVENDVRSDVAQRAAKECARRIEWNMVLGFGVSTAVGVATRNPGALLMGAAGGVLFGAGTLIGSPSCEDVRKAALKLSGGS